MRSISNRTYTSKMFIELQIQQIVRRKKVFQILGTLI